MASETRSFEIEGIKFYILEGFQKLYRVLASLEKNPKWDVLALDQYMTVEIVSLGDKVRLAMYAEVDGKKLPPDIMQQEEVEIEVREEKIILKSFYEYPAMSKYTAMAIVKRINSFRQVLSSILSF
ncbi:MAG: hypothetical protein ACP5IE_04540 [Infirmifilum sp.]